MMANAEHPVWEQIGPELSPRDFYRPFEMDVWFLKQLSIARRRAGVPFWIVSDARTSADGVGVPNSAHHSRPCKCVDIRCMNNEHRFRIVMALATVMLTDECWSRIEDGLAGFTRFGVYPPTDWQAKTYGKGSGSIHVDGEAMAKPSPRMWMSY